MTHYFQPLSIRRISAVPSNSARIPKKEAKCATFRLPHLAFCLPQCPLSSYPTARHARCKCP